MARIKVEDRETCFKRLRKRRLGGSNETNMGQRPEILESCRALCWRCPYLIKEGDLCINDGFYSYETEDSKSLDQSGYAQWIEDVDNLKILIEEVRLDQDIKTQVLCMSFYVNLVYDAVISRGMQHQWFDITKSAHSYPMWENQRETLGRRIPSVTDLTGRVQQLVYLNRPV